MERHEAGPAFEEADLRLNKEAPYSRTAGAQLRREERYQTPAQVYGMAS
jgi:hypothetical protein